MVHTGESSCDVKQGASDDHVAGRAGERAAERRSLDRRAVQCTVRGEDHLQVTIEVGLELLLVTGVQVVEAGLGELAGLAHADSPPSGFWCGHKP